MSANWQQLGLTGRPWRKLVRLVLDTYGYDCWLRWDLSCSQLATTADHVQPRSQGGSDDLANLRPACSHCNSARGDRPLTARPRVERIDGRGFFDSRPAGNPAPPVRFFSNPETNRDELQPTQPALDLTFWSMA